MRTQSQRNAQYAKRRLCKMREVCPDLSDQALATTTLRALSFSVRRMRPGGLQTVLPKVNAPNPEPHSDSAGIVDSREQLAHTQASDAGATGSVLDTQVGP